MSVRGEQREGRIILEDGTCVWWPVCSLDLESAESSWF